MSLELELAVAAHEMWRAGQCAQRIAWHAHRAPLAGAAAGAAAAADAADAADAGGAVPVALAGSVNGPFWPQAGSAIKTMVAVHATSVDTLHTRLFRFPLLAMRGILVSTPAASPGTPSVAQAAFSDADYVRESSALLAHIEATCDRWLDDDVIDIDTHRTGGLLELVFPDRSKVVVNTQPPLHEMGVAARSGGYHYRWDGSCWRDTRDGHELLEMLSRQASAQGGCVLRF